MIGLALTACFICPLGVFLSIAFLILGKRGKENTSSIVSMAGLCYYFVRQCI